MKAKRTLVVVADGVHARLFLSDGPGKGLHAVADGVMEGKRPVEHEIGSGAPGRSVESVGGHRHAIEPKTSYHDEVEHAFLATVIERLEQKRAAKAFDALIVIAEPRALGELRKRLSAPLAAMLTATLDKDLTKATLDHISDAAAKLATI